MDSHPVCNECGGKGCEKCHNGWECTGEDCNKCEMGWELGHLKNWHRDTPNPPVMPYNNLISKNFILW